MLKLYMTSMGFKIRLALLQALLPSQMLLKLGVIAIMGLGCTRRRKNSLFLSIRIIRNKARNLSIAGVKILSE